MATVTASAAAWIEDLQYGVLKLTEIDTLVNMPMSELIEQLHATYPVRFLEFRRRAKWEMGLAGVARRSERRVANGKKSDDSKTITHTFIPCLLLTSETERLTSIAAMARLSMRTSRREAATFELISSAGFNLFSDLDEGWKITLTENCTVNLTREYLVKKGWIFSS